MSKRLEYLASQQLEMAALDIRSTTGANPFYSLLMATMRQADTYNVELLSRIYPTIFKELKDRYHAPGGMLEGED